MMGLPVIKIDFKQMAKTAPIRSQRGIVALILSDSNTDKFSIVTEEDIPSTISESNKKIIKETLLGNATSPNKILVYVIGTSGSLSDALAYFETQEFNYLTMPGAETSDLTAITSFIEKMRNVINYRCQAILNDKAADKEGISNFTAKNIKVNGALIEDYSHRYAGAVAGTPLNQSVTFAVFPEVEEIETLTKEQADTRIDQGEVILVREMGKIRIARGVTSLVTTTDTKGTDFQKIKLVSTLDLIHNDIRKVIVEKYIGKVPNNYDHKCILITEIKEYLDDLAKENLVEKAIEVGIDFEAQKKWLKDNTNLNIDEMSEQEIKEANTKDKVFIAIALKLVDAMEDVYINVAL